MRLRPTHDQLQGLDDGLSRAIELVVTPLVFAAIGWVLDGLIGIRPALTITLGVWALIGVAVSTWYTYDAEMRRHETALAERRSPARAPSGEVT